MRNPVLGQTYYTVVPVTDAAGYLVDADALPTGTVYKNGVASATVVTVTDIGVGRYRVSFVMTAGEGFAQGDAVSLLFFATIGGVTTGRRVDQFYISPAGWTGPSTVTLTVRDSVTLVGIAGAVVWVLDSTATYTCGIATTNGAGIATLYLADGSYVVRVSGVGYTFTDANLVVAGATALTIDGTAYTAHPTPIVVVVSGAVGTVASELVDIVQYDTEIPLEGRLREADGTTVVDLSIALSVSFQMRKGGSDSNPIIGGACVITDALNGVVQYAWGTNDLDTPGDYLAEFEVTWASNRPETFPHGKPFQIHVRPDLD